MATAECWKWVIASEELNITGLGISFMIVAPYDDFYLYLNANYNEQSFYLL